MVKIQCLDQIMGVHTLEPPLEHVPGAGPVTE